MLSLTWRTTTAQQMPAGSTDASGIPAPLSYKEHWSCRFHLQTHAHVETTQKTCARTHTYKQPKACTQMLNHMPAHSERQRAALWADYEGFILLCVPGAVGLHERRGGRSKCVCFRTLLRINPLDLKVKKKCMKLDETDAVIAKLSKGKLGRNKDNNTSSWDRGALFMKYYKGGFQSFDRAKASAPHKWLAHQSS